VAHIRLAQTYGSSTLVQVCGRPKGSRGPDLTHVDIEHARNQAARKGRLGKGYTDVTLVGRTGETDHEIIVL
jgi:hypothetical protein